MEESEETARSPALNDNQIRKAINMFSEIMYLSNRVISKRILSSEQKIEEIIKYFNESDAVILDKKGLYYEKDLSGFGSLGSLNEYLAKTKGLAVNAGGRCGYTLLATTAMYNDAGVAKWLVEVQGADIELGTDFDQAPLAIAAEYGYVDVISYLISIGADINRPTATSAGDTSTGGYREGTTPLHFAVKFGQVDAVKLLLAHGAVLSKDDGRISRDPIDVAYLMVEILHSLEENKEHPEAEGWIGTARHRARTPALSNMKEILEILLAHRKELENTKEAKPAEQRKNLSLFARLPKEQMPLQSSNRILKALSIGLLGKQPQQLVQQKPTVEMKAYDTKQKIDVQEPESPQSQHGRPNKCRTM